MVHDDAAARADLARLAERLEQAEAQLLAGHLNQSERRDLGDLVLRTVAAEAFDETPEDEVAVGLENHIDEVDDDDAADIAQAKLADDLFSRLEVVLRHGLFEVSARTDELAGVHVDDGHRLGAVDHQRTTRGQPHLAVERLLDLFADAVLVERVPLTRVRLNTVEEVWCDLAQVALDRLASVVAGDDQFLEVLVEDVAHDLDEQVGLAVEQSRGLD